MNNNRVSLEQASESITKIIGEDWGHPRSKAYIAAHIAMLQSTIKELEEKLYLETEVNKRVREALRLVR